MRNLLRRTVPLAIGALLCGLAAAPAAAAQPPPVTVQLLDITDFHGHLQPPAPGDGGTVTGPDGRTVTVGGAAYLAAQLERLRAGHRNTVTFATGDSFSGWPFEVDAFRDEPTVEVLNRLGLRFSAAGNHELDVSPGFLVDHMEHGRCFGTVDRDSCFTDSTGRRFHGADFDFQSANLVDAATGRPVLAPYRVEWFDGPGGTRLPVGFIGLTIPDTPTGSTSFQPGLRALDELRTADRYAAELRRKGVRAIVLNVHDGGAQRDPAAGYDGCGSAWGPAIDLAARVSPDIDAITTGHWHHAFRCVLPDPAGNPRPVLEAGHHGGVVSEIDLALDPRTGEVIRDRTTSVNHPVTRDLPPDPAVQRITDYWVDRAAERRSEPLARQTGSFTRAEDADGESTAADFFADVQLWDAARTPGGHADLALLAARPAVGATAVRGDLPYDRGDTPGDADGRVLLGESWDAYGYGNPVLSVKLTGSRLKAVLEQQWQSRSDGSVRFAPLAVSGNVSYRYDPQRPVGRRIDPAEVLIGGKPLDLRRTYRVAALAYTVVGGDGYPAFSGYTDPVRCGTDHEVLVDYLRAHPVISPAPLDRVRRTA
ncbi:bifunctional metallophosphatase/5'-nucleotidase [Peterkaempfera bronchialis]|uniref:bifunctional metallophosphatase/5'-nucleotidase n=1 Tax=Peterkaempfera bronchialis TaxID=2126346 RepID=UPI001E308439|nr:bifunctional UDP-sugar hydrolase/5'-nucleotidase [Peterkaempfera bronchialis]